MIEQLKTIRSGIEKAHIIGGQDAIDKALTALTHLEAMVGAQEPVAWAVYWGLPPTRKNSVHFDKESAQAVANQIKSATEVRPLYAAPVAQQPQARPDFTDEWTGYLKDGETPFERFLRERKDMQSVLKLYQRALEENERLKAQPQAEAVPSSRLIDPGSVVSFAVDRWLAEVANRPLVNKNRRTLDDTWRQVIRHFGGDPDALIGPDHDTLLAAAPQQAEAVPPGYVLVPVEPTDEMIQGFWGDITHGEPEREAAKEAWRKAIDAAIAQQKGN